MPTEKPPVIHRSICDFWEVIAQLPQGRKLIPDRDNNFTIYDRDYRPIGFINHRLGTIDLYAEPRPGIFDAEGVGRD